LNSERRNSKEGSVRKGHEIPKESNYAQFGGWKFCKISKTTWRPMPKFVSYPSDAACKKTNLRCNDGKCYCCSKLDVFGKNDAALNHDKDLSGSVRNKMRNAMHRTMQEDICLVRAEQRSFEVAARRLCEKTRDIRAAQCEKVWVAKQKEWCQQLAELEAANDWVEKLSNSCAKRTSEEGKRHGIRKASQKQFDMMLATIRKEKAFIIDMKNLLKKLISTGNPKAGEEVMEALAISASSMNPDSQALIEEARKSPQAAKINCLLGELWNKLNEEEMSLRRKHDHAVREHEYSVWIKTWTCAIRASAMIHAKKQAEQENIAEKVRISNEKLCYKRVEQYDAEVADYHEVREVYEQEMKYATNMEIQIAQWTGKVGADYWCKQRKITVPKVTLLHERKARMCFGGLIRAPTKNTERNCDRKYKVPGGMIDKYAKDAKNTYWLQDVHDPNDHPYKHQKFVKLDIGSPAKVIACMHHCSSGVKHMECKRMHATRPEDRPNAIDPAGGWKNEGNISKTMVCWAKKFNAGSHTLYHSTKLGWGYNYIVQMV